MICKKKKKQQKPPRHAGLEEIRENNKYTELFIFFSSILVIPAFFMLPYFLHKENKYIYITFKDKIYDNYFQDVWMAVPKFWTPIIIKRDPPQTNYKAHIARGVNILYIRKKGKVIRYEVEDMGMYNNHPSVELFSFTLHDNGKWMRLKLYFNKHKKLVGHFGQPEERPFAWIDSNIKYIEPTYVEDDS
jgi:hypothetical protein